MRSTKLISTARSESSSMPRRIRRAAAGCDARNAFARERDYAVAVVWKPTEVMYDPI
jgi:hypothetical protein